MCTVTYIPLKQTDYVLTQNRDVSTKRPQAEPPRYHDYHGLSLYYPIDVKGGGTWNAISPIHHAFLLNGADYSYYPDFNAPKSRGSLCLELLKEGKKIMEDQDFKDYDDFTLILFSRNLDTEIDEWRWNGEKLMHISRPIDQSYIWISRGMYSREDYFRKREVFKQFISEIEGRSNSVVMDMVWAFHHQKTVKGEEGLLISRPYHLGTVSVIQVGQEDGILTSRYEDRTDYFERQS